MQWINKNIIDTDDVEGEKGWVKEIPSQLSLRPGVKWMVAPPHLLPICQVVKHVSGLLRSPDPQVTIGDLTHQSATNTTENPSKFQPKACDTRCINNCGRWSSTPKTHELYFNQNYNQSCVDNSMSWLTSPICLFSRLWKQCVQGEFLQSGSRH